MSRISIILCAALVLVGIAPAQAEYAPTNASATSVKCGCTPQASCAVANTMQRKLGRGFANVCTFPVEIYNQANKTDAAYGPGAAFTWGIAKGAVMMCGRLLVGVYEIATFPLPIPCGYQPILTDPEFFFADNSF